MAKTATAERLLPLPLQFLAAWIGMWLGEHQAQVIEYQRAENAALLERLGEHRLRLTDGGTSAAGEAGQSALLPTRCPPAEPDPRWGRPTV